MKCTARRLALQVQRTHSVWTELLHFSLPATLMIEPTFSYHAPSSSRRIAGLSGFLILIQALLRPDPAHPAAC